jgi:hypothetical protein
MVIFHIVILLIRNEIKNSSGNSSDLDGLSLEVRPEMMRGVLDGLPDMLGVRFEFLPALLGG